MEVTLECVCQSGKYGEHYLIGRDKALLLNESWYDS